jgi:hypothetical protein
VEIGTFSSLIAEGRTCQLHYLNKRVVRNKDRDENPLTEILPSNKVRQIDSSPIAKAGANSKIKIKFVMLIMWID